MLVTLTVLLFRECVDVGYSEGNADRELPWYRSLQWAWFCFAMWCAYGLKMIKAPLELFDRFEPWIKNVTGPTLAFLFQARHYHYEVSIVLYSGAFCATVLSLRKGYYALQLRILSFTVLALSLFVFQMKVAIFNVFVGLFWFLFPLVLVAVNDSAAYLFGFCFGKRFIRKPLLELSPNKTWEGFLGAAATTLAAGWLLPPLLATPFLACSYMDVKTVGLEACPVPDFFTNGNIRWHGLLLAFYASFIAPFGGFFASAIKRAYGLKDFSSLIPGHGGFMDRFDCQFMMALFTWVHIVTFIHPSSPLSEAQALVESMSLEDQRELLSTLASSLGVRCQGTTW
mmetsp:Transcript_27265/g.79459  ORF Transcript_27265/g.79459 Transcript_27265/m.79459 type:complete len:341 (+) Transcript_27265:334-1356(+)